MHFMCIFSFGVPPHCVYTCIHIDFLDIYCGFREPSIFTVVFETYEFSCVYTYGCSCVYTYGFSCVYTYGCSCVYTYRIVCVYTYGILCQYT